MFAPHNLLSDPPFSRLDLISCRNLLIYLDDVSIQAVPITNATNQQLFLILFEEMKESENTLSKGSDNIARRNHLLENERASLRKDMHLIIEEQEASNEELQSMNEEPGHGPGPAWQFTFLDTGMGIPGKIIGRILDTEHEEADADSGKKINEPDEAHGEGIGLFIVKRLCELLKAKMRITNNMDSGTEFKIIFPKTY